MERRDRILLALLAAAAAAAAGLALRFGRGTLDSSSPPPLPPAGTGDGSPRLRNLPAPVLPPGFPAPAAALLRSAWARIESGTDAEAAAAFVTLTPLGAENPLNDCAPAALEAMGPGLGVLIKERNGRLSVAAMRCAAALARAGGLPGREALARSHLLDKAFALQAMEGPTDLQVEAARLLGFAGGKEAMAWLAELLRRGRTPEVKGAAAAGMAEAFDPADPIPLEAITAIREAAGSAGESPVFRRSCVDAFDRAWEAFRPYDVGPAAAAALADPDRSLRAAAASFFRDHPLGAQSGDLVKAAAAEPDAFVLEMVADALAVLKPPGGREALEGRLKTLTDPAARKGVERALREMGP